MLDILSDLSEVVHYPVPDFPLFAGYGYLNRQNQYGVGCHSHPDFEFNLVLEGSMDYFVNGETVHLEPGEGIFVNSQRLHYNYSQAHRPAKYLVLTVSPELFPRSLPAVAALLEEKTRFDCTDYLKLCQPGLPAQYEGILHQVEAGIPDPLHTLAMVQALCAGVLPQLRPAAHTTAHDAAWLCLHQMTQYLHAHYQERVMLSDIAAAGQVCRSRCCQLFTTYLGQSPIDYLNGYRLKKSLPLLLGTRCSVGEAAARCGFCNQSYYTQLFRRQYGCTPREYRSKARESAGNGIS